jgi:hypothetical protein
VPKEWTAKYKGKFDQDWDKLLLFEEKDNTFPWAVANVSFPLPQRNVGVTEILEMPNREHPAGLP